MTEIGNGSSPKMLAVTVDNAVDFIDVAFEEDLVADVADAGWDRYLVDDFSNCTAVCWRSTAAFACASLKDRPCDI